MFNFIANLILLTFLIFSSAALAVPHYTEIWFISPPKLTFFEQFIKHKEGNFLNQLWASLEHTQCQPAEDGFFHPQIGLHFHEGKKIKNEEKRPAVESEREQMGAIYKENQDLITCDNSTYFNMFCGKSKDEKISDRGYEHVLEVWVDISSSLNAVDRADKSGGCYRRSFIERLNTTCTDPKFSVSVFDTSIKTMGGTNQLCLGVGLNDQDRLINWIKNSHAKNLIIITDINEVSHKLVDYVFSIGGKLKGEVPQKELHAKDLLDLVDVWKKKCQ